MKIEVKTIDGKDFTISYQHSLVMFHSSYISSQADPDMIGVNIMRQIDDSTYLGISATIPLNAPLEYFSNAHTTYILSGDSFYTVLKFFKDLGFPCPNAI